MAVYLIGGSPCSGKSTVAEALAAKHGLYYFKVDDHLDRYLQMGAADGRECCLCAGRMTPDQIWMREPQVQCEEELAIYGEIAGYVMADLHAVACGGNTIAEGAAFLPVLAKQMQLPMDRYIAIAPTEEFQLFHYRKREWVPYVLAECSDKAKAFENWMNRDVLFAQAVRKQCAEAGYVSLVNDGSMSVEALIGAVENHFGLA